MKQDRLKSALNGQLTEFLDGYFLVGFDTSGDCVLCCNVLDAKTALAINNILSGIMSQGGISVEVADG